MAAAINRERDHRQRDPARRRRRPTASSRTGSTPSAKPRTPTRRGCRRTATSTRAREELRTGGDAEGGDHAPLRRLAGESRRGARRARRLERARHRDDAPLERARRVHGLPRARSARTRWTCTSSTCRSRFPTPARRWTCGHVRSPRNKTTFCNGATTARSSGRGRSSIAVARTDLYTEADLAALGDERADARHPAAVADLHQSRSPVVAEHVRDRPVRTHRPRPPCVSN